MIGRYGDGGAIVNPEQEAEVEFRNRTARQYAELVSQRGAYWWYAVREFLLRRLGLRRGGWLYDAGCGVGLYAVPIVERYPQVRVWAVDFSAESLRLLEEQVRQRGIQERVCCVQADITAWIPPEPVQWVLCTEVIQHIPTAELRLRALRCFYQSLAPQGELCLLVARYTWQDRQRGIPKEIDERDRGGYFRMRFTPMEVRSLLRQAGFRTIRLLGAPVPSVRIGRRLPARLWWLSHWLQGFPGSGNVGKVILAFARRW